jgi:hypothetical protein
MSKFSHQVKHFIQDWIPPAVFFFVSFQLLALTQSLMLRQYGIDVTTFVEATIGALVVSKVVALADLLPFLHRFPGRPLIYNIAWKTAIYFVAAFVVRYLEAFIHFYRQQGEIRGANRHMLDEVIWPHFWAIQMWLMVLLLVYCTVDALVSAVGRDRLRELFFGISSKAAPEANAGEAR